MNSKQRKKIISMIKRGIKISNQISDKYAKNIESDLNYIARTCIDKFYESYDPLVYDRYGDLYNTFKIVVNNKKLKILFSDSLMRYEHRVNNEYIFENSFIYGWHGGARSGPDHPNPGQAWWREPTPYYTHWKSPAAKSDSPYEQIDKNITIYILRKKIAMQEEYEQKVEKPIIDYLKKEGLI